MKQKKYIFLLIVLIQCAENQNQTNPSIDTETNQGNLGSHIGDLPDIDEDITKLESNAEPVDKNITTNENKSDEKQEINKPVIKTNDKNQRKNLKEVDPELAKLENALLLSRDNQSTQETVYRLALYLSKNLENIKLLKKETLFILFRRYNLRYNNQEIDTISSIDKIINFENKKGVFDKLDTNEKLTFLTAAIKYATPNNPSIRKYEDRLNFIKKGKFFSDDLITSTEKFRKLSVKKGLSDNEQKNLYKLLKKAAIVPDLKETVDQLYHKNLNDYIIYLPIIEKDLKTLNLSYEIFNKHIKHPSNKTTILIMPFILEGRNGEEYQLQLDFVLKKLNEVNKISIQNSQNIIRACSVITIKSPKINKEIIKFALDKSEDSLQKNFIETAIMEGTNNNKFLKILINNPNMQSFNKKQKIKQKIIIQEEVINLLKTYKISNI